MARTTSQDDICRFYNRMGKTQDKQAFYEDTAINRMIRLGRLSDASAVFEFGCGTGRLAERLLTNDLSSLARYVAIDLSPTMIGLARDRLQSFGQRCRVHRSAGGFDFSSYGGRFDRFVTTYVLDLLTFEEIRGVFASAHAITRPGGLFCHAGLTVGIGPVSKTTSTLWTLTHRLRPMLLGGCRPLEVATLIPRQSWRLIHREVTVSMAIPSEVVIAERLENDS